MVVVEEGTAWSVGDDEADGEGVVAEEVGEAVDGRGFHLEVGYLEWLSGPREGGEFFVEVGDGGVQADGATLGAVEARGCGGDAEVHAEGYLVEQQRAGTDAVGMGEGGGE